MEPSASLATEAAPASPLPQVGAVAPSVKHSFPWLILLGFFVFAAIGLNGYLYMQNAQLKEGLQTSQALVTELKAQAPRDRNVTLVGPLSNAVFKIDDTKSLFIDMNGGAWIVNFQIASFKSSLQASTSSKEKTFATISEWIDAQNGIGAPLKPDLPGRTTVTGTFKGDLGIVLADTVELSK